MTKHATWLTLLASILCCLGVLIGAFGGHGLEKYLDQAAKSTFEIGVRYQFYHGLALFALAYLQENKISAFKPALLMTAGVFLFSGSLYAYILSGVREFAFVTPFGGTLMIVSWLWLIKNIFNSLRKH